LCWAGLSLAFVGWKVSVGYLDVLLSFRESTSGGGLRILTWKYGPQQRAAVALRRKVSGGDGGLLNSCNCSVRRVVQIAVALAVVKRRSAAMAAGGNADVAADPEPIRRHLRFDFCPAERAAGRGGLAAGTPYLNAAYRFAIGLLGVRDCQFEVLQSELGPRLWRTGLHVVAD